MTTVERVPQAFTLVEKPQAGNDLEYQYFVTAYEDDETCPRRGHARSGGKDRGAGLRSVRKSNGSC